MARVKVRGWQTRNNKGSKLTVSSMVGDVAVLLIHGQVEKMGDMTPAGWTGRYYTDPNGRSVTVAVKKVAAEADTRDLKWWNDRADYVARQSAVLVVLDRATVANASTGVIAAGTGALTDLKPSETEPQLVAFFDDATKDEHVVGLPDGAQVIESGRSFESTTRSWTSIEVGILYAPGSKAPGTVVKSSTAIPLVLVAQAATYEPTMGDGTSTSWQVHPGIGAMVRAVPGGYTVSDLLSSRPILCGHHGTSTAGFGEHSAQGYTAAVARGCQALEMSLSRTKDGVWWGLHDADLSRLGGPATKAIDMTWEQVKAAIKDFKYKPVTLDWLMKTYGKTHVLVLDPKYMTGSWGELCDTLEAWKEWDPKEHVFIKSYAESLNWLFAPVLARGYKTWAYAYGEKDRPWWAEFCKASSITVRSVDYTQPKEIWDQVLKGSPTPTIAHIPADRTQYKTGMDKGAAGAIVSSPDALGDRIL